METENGYVIYRHNNLPAAYVSDILFGLRMVMLDYLTPEKTDMGEFRAYSINFKKDNLPIRGII